MAENLENTERESRLFRPPIEFVRTMNPENPEGLPWHWELRYYAGSPLGYISIGEITTGAVTAREALETLLLHINSLIQNVRS